MHTCVCWLKTRALNPGADCTSRLQAAASDAAAATPMEADEPAGAGPAEGAAAAPAPSQLPEVELAAYLLVLMFQVDRAQWKQVTNSKRTTPGSPLCCRAVARLGASWAEASTCLHMPRVAVSAAGIRPGRAGCGAAARLQPPHPGRHCSSHLLLLLAGGRAHRAAARHPRVRRCRAQKGHCASQPRARARAHGRPHPPPLTPTPPQQPAPTPPPWRPAAAP